VRSSPGTEALRTVLGRLVHLAGNFGSEVFCGSGGAAGGGLFKRQQQTVHTLESALSEYERCQSSNNVNDMGQPHGNKVERDIAEKEQLETRIRDLENEMIQEHESALANVANHVCAAKRKSDQTEKTRQTA
jgi:hypothetical protein